MKTKYKPQNELVMEDVLNNLDVQFEKEFREELFIVESDIQDDGFDALKDFYNGFNSEVQEREECLQAKLYRNVITIKEFEELEAIAVVKYPEVKFDEIEDFYRMTYSKSDEIERIVISKKENADMIVG